MQRVSPIDLLVGPTELHVYRFHANLSGPIIKSRAIRSVPFPWGDRRRSMDLSKEVSQGLPTGHDRPFLNYARSGTSAGDTKLRTRRDQSGAWASLRANTFCFTERGKREVKNGRITKLEASRRECSSLGHACAPLRRKRVESGRRAAKRTFYVPLCGKINRLCFSITYSGTTHLSKKMENNGEESARIDPPPDGEINRSVFPGKIQSRFPIIRKHGNTIAEAIMVECHCARTRGGSSLIAGQWNLTRRGWRLSYWSRESGKHKMHNNDLCLFEIWHNSWISND